MLLKQLYNFHSRLKIRAKITIPFVVTFIVLWLLGTSLLGYYFSLKLRQEQTENLEELTLLVAERFERELYQLRQTARLLATKDLLNIAVANEHVAALRQEVLPLAAILQDDWIGIVNRDREFLLDLRQPDLHNEMLFSEAAVQEVISGADISTLMTGQSQNLSLLIGTAPVKDNSGIVGGVILGRQLNGGLLSEFSARLDVELVALSSYAVVGHSFDEVTAADLETLKTNTSDTITIGQNRYFQVSLPLEGISGEQITILVLRNRSIYEASLTTIRLAVGILALIGVGTAIGVGYWIGERIAHPIRGLAEAASQVSQGGNFGVRVAVMSQDELGMLARSLNQLIEWSGYYTNALESAAQTLEQRVKERTQDLEAAVQELQHTQLQLIQSEKMSSLGQMVAGIAHEINNPVAFIQGNSFHLQKYFEDFCQLLQQYQETYEPTSAITQTIDNIDLPFLLEDTQKVIHSIEMGSKRVKDIVLALRNFSRLDESAIKEVDIHEGLESTLLILHHRLNPNIEVIKNYGELPPVRCYPAQLNQVFTNIITNAADAMDEFKSEVKKLTITTRAIEDEKIQVSCRDTGPGIPQKNQQKIFDPFFTTKTVGKGTGLGLGICYQIIQKHTGKIEVISEVGQGAEFVVTLPTQVLPTA